MQIHRLYLGLLSLLCLPWVGRAQSPVPLHEGGLLLPRYMAHFTPEDYGGYHQNWAVTQDARGIVYVGNNDGVLEFDGARWRMIETETAVRSLAVDAEGTVYAGIQGDFGYLGPDSLGSLRFVSLLPEVDSTARDFKDVWGTHATAGGIYFQSNAYLFRWDGARMHRWAARKSFHTSFVVHDRVFVREAGVGLQEVVGDSLRLVPGGERFRDRRIYMMAPYEGGEVLVATQEEGLFLYDGRAFTPFPTEADAFLRKYKLYHGTALPGGRYALATLGGGVLVIDARGALVSVLSQPGDLPDNVVNYVFADAEGGMWLALNNNGIVRVADLGRVTQYDHRLGLHGAVYDVARHKGNLYVATGGTPGLYVLKPQALSQRLDGDRSSFVPVENVPRSWSLLSIDSTFFVGTDEQIYQLNKYDQFTSYGGEKVYALEASDYYDGVIYVGQQDGLALLRHTDAGWHLTKVSGVEDDVRHIVEEADGTLWVGTRHAGVLRLRFTRGLDQPPRTDAINLAGAHLEKSLVVTKVGGRPLFYHDEGRTVYRFREGSPAEPGAARHQFVPDPALAPLVEAAGDTLKAVAEDAAGNVWLAYAGGMQLARRTADGTYQRVAIPELQFPRWSVEMLYAEPGVLWIGNGNVLYRYTPAMPALQAAPFAALIRQVHTTDSERLLFGGALGEEARRAGRGRPHLYLNFDDNDLAFEVAAPYFTRSDEIVYRYYLEGYDRAWTPWTPTARKTYVNLREGTYHFHVQARNAWGQLSEEAVYTFVIRPPWARTWWAYSLYALAVLALLFFAWKYVQMVKAQRKAEEQAKELEQEREVNERLQQANDQLKVANERLKQANKLKDEFLATTSHELRTPLTAILGFTEVLKYEVPDEAPYREFLGIIEESGNRLMQTLTSLLEIAKLRAGVMEIQRVPTDLVRHAVDVTRMFSEMARKKGLTLTLNPPREPVYALVDVSAFERVLSNLVSNAVKFTEEGEVMVSFSRDEDRIHIHITDTGIGISEKFQPYLFEEFRQESDGLSRSHEGTGLGLAITARLVELMEGEITVQSVKGEGSVFTVSFPACAPPPSAGRPAVRVPSSVDGLPSGPATA